VCVFCACVRVDKNRRRYWDARSYQPTNPTNRNSPNRITATDPQTVLAFRGVRLQKGEYVILEGLDWKVMQGQVWAVKGLNGSGKSTTTRLLMVGALGADGAGALDRLSDCLTA
jgi:ABC-type molybdenum transport system ATPase subunit/photorepair protein PhrA